MDTASHPAAGEGATPSGPGGALRQAHITLLGSGIGAALAIVNEIICARYLGVNMYGLYALALILARISESVAIFGLSVATLRYVSIYRDRDQPRYVLGTILASLLPPMLIGLGLAAGLWVLAPVLADEVFGKPGAGPFIRAMALAIPFMGLSEVLAVITRGFGHAAYYVVVRSLVPPLVFLAMLLLITSTRADPHWVAGAFGLAYAIAAGAGVVAVLKVGGRDLFRLKPQLPFQSLYGYAFPVLLNNLMYIVVACTSILLLGVMQTEKDVGIYRACMQIVIPFDMVELAFLAAVGRAFSVLEHNGRREELADLLGKTTRWMTMFALALLLLLAFNRHDLLALMGAEFVAGGTTLMVLVLGQAALLCTGSVAVLLVMSGRQGIETANVAFAALLSLVLNLALIPAWGGVGAALASSSSCLLLGALRVVRVKRSMGLRFPLASIVRILAPAALTALAVSMATLVLPIGEGRGIPALAARMALIASLLALSYWFIGLKPADRRGATAAVRAYFAGRRS